MDNPTATYSGNQIALLRYDAADVLLESSLDMPHGQWSGSDFAYDRNGNQTRDLSRGVSDIQYNELNLPERIEMASGGTIEYLYTAAGTKLAEIIRDQEGGLLNRRDYVGMFEFESDSLRAIALASGFVSAADTTFHLYVHDYQGNVTGVYNTRSGALEQFTDFYPYGRPHTMTRRADAASNRRLYSAKELTTDHGLNIYDFEARHLAPAFPRFTTPDPLATDYTPFSIYNLCAGEPINFIDPTGMNVWSVDANGNFKLIEETTEYDKFIFINDDGLPIANNEGNEVSIQFDYGTVKTVANENDYDRVEINGNNNGKNLFEFLANNISVEPNEIEFSWLAPRENKGNKNKTNYIYTSHESRADGGMLKHYHWMRTHKRLFDIYDFTHSHPDAPYPSTADTNVAYMISENNHRKFGSSTNNYIYHVPTKSYIPYKGIKPDDKIIKKVSY